jgi:cytochrome c-type biogenesis protein CcmH
MKRVILTLAAVLSLAGPAWAEEAKPMASNPVLEQRMINLAQNLRCLVCQNESLAASQAGLAADLREEIREQLKAGKTDKQVIKYLTDRYGDFVLYRPPFKPKTYLLWFGPLGFLGIGAIGWYITLRKRRSIQAATQVSQEVLQQAANLLEADETQSPAPRSGKI